MRVVFPVTRSRRHNALQNVVAGLQVSVPEMILGVRERIGKVLDFGIQTLAVKDLDEGQVHIDIVIQIRSSVIAILDVTRIPADVNVLVDRYGPFKFCRTAVRTSDNLSGPPAKHLILEDFLGDGNIGTVGYRRRGYSEQSSRYR